MNFRSFLSGSSFAGTAHLAEPSATFAHVPSLDGFRALSIIAVLLTHFILPRGPGGYGVFLFFIISGYLITRLLFAEQQLQPVKIKDFYIRRIFRLYPVLLVFTAVAVAIAFFEYGIIVWDEAASALFYYSNYLIVHKELNSIPWHMEAFRVFWSLSVEEHFYLIWPIIFVVLRTPHKILIFSLVTILACTVGRYIMATNNPELIETHYFGMLSQYRIDSIALGVLLAAVCQIPVGQWLVQRADRHWVLAIAIVVLISGFVLLRDPALKTALRWPLLGFPLLVMMAAVLFSPRYWLLIAFLNHPTMVWTGRLSYSLYVWHMLAGYAAFAMFPSSVGAVVAIMLAYILAAISYFLIEQPMIRLRKQLQANRAKPKKDVATELPLSI